MRNAHTYRVRAEVTNILREVAIAVERVGRLGRTQQSNPNALDTQHPCDLGQTPDPLSQGVSTGFREAKKPTYPSTVCD